MNNKGRQRARMQYLPQPKRFEDSVSVGISLAIHEACFYHMLNEADNPCTVLQWIRLHENARRSCTQLVFLVRIGRNSELAALRHFLFFRSAHASWRSLFNAAQGCHKYVNGVCFLM